jgi:peptidoglycan/LPS O-acetylase OafA/YrhL
MKPPNPPLTFEAYRETRYFTALDGLRALAILLVVMHHGPRSEGWAAVLADNGRYGVSLFFIISGFLIGTLLLRELRCHGRVSLGRFYGRRALRLLPLYYAVLALQAFIVLVLRQYRPESQELFLQKLPAYLFYYSNWLPTATDGPFFCAWSLAVEEQFYLGFGLLIVVLRKNWLVATLACALALKFAVFQFVGNVDVDSTLWRIVFSYQEAILWGVLLAFALEQRELYERLAGALGSPWMLAGLGLIIAGGLSLYPITASSTWDAEVLYGLMTLLVAGLVMRRAVPGLCHPWLVHLGRISYGIYLLHMLVICLVVRIPYGMSPIFCFIVTTGVVSLIATGVYFCFELPIIRFYKHRFSSDQDNLGRVSVISPDLERAQTGSTG